MRTSFLAFLAVTAYLTVSSEAFPASTSSFLGEDKSVPALLPKAVPAEVKPPAPETAKPVTPPPIAQPVQMKPVISEAKKMAPQGKIAKAIFSNNGDGQRLIISFNNKPKLTVRAENGAVVLRLAATVSFEAEKVPDEFAGAFTGISKSGDGKSITVNLAGAQPKISQNKMMVIIDVAGANKNYKPEIVEKAQVVKPEAVKTGATKMAGYNFENDVEKFKFGFGRPTPAAVFERFGYYWLVFDTDEDVDLPDAVKKSPIFASVKKVKALTDESVVPENFTPPAKNPLIYVLELKKEAYAMAARNGNNWEVSFDPNIAYQQDKPLKLEDAVDTWQINAKSVADKITVKDEITNAQLQIYPLLDAGFIGAEVKNQSFVLGKTVQGVAIEPIGRIAGKNDEKDKIKIIKPTNAPSAATADKPIDIMSAEDARPIYAFKKWAQLKGDEYRRAELKIKGGDRAEFAKFLFSQQLYPEAAVNFRGVPGFEASFLTGASLYLTGHDEEAIKIFDALALPEGVDKNELLLWRAAAAHELADLRPGGQPVDLGSFALAKNVANYPDNIRSRLLISATEELVDQAKYDNAEGFINVLNKVPLDDAGKSYVKYLQARVYDGQGKKARAREVWAEVAKANTDRESRAKAGFEVTMQDLAAARIKPEDAIKQLNDIRIVWRGDGFEYKLLKELGDLYMQTGADFEALHTMKELLASFPNYPDNPAETAKMREVFERAITTALADKDKTFKAVTIYYEFGELKPSGPKGDEITLQLADALAKYDLLDDAIKVLQKYYGGLADDAQKGEVSTRIAILQYLNSKPKDALETLKKSDGKGISGNLVAERKILEIRCLIDTNELAIANSQLSGIPDEQAYKFKTDIYWKQKKWQEMLDSYGLVADRDDEDIMRMAIAYALLDDKKNLGDLRKQYSARMEKSEFAQNFDYVTNVDNVDFRNLTGSLHLDQTKKVLGEYKAKAKVELPKPAAAQTTKPTSTPSK